MTDFQREQRAGAVAATWLLLSAVAGVVACGVGLAKVVEWVL